MAIVAMLGWDSAIKRADQQTSKAAAAQAAAAQATTLQQQVDALQRELASSKEREQALQGQAASGLAQAQSKAAGSDAAEARAATAEKAAAEAERSRVEAQARVDALELAARTADRTADRRPPAGAVPAAPTSSLPAAPPGAETATGASPALPLPGLPEDATARDYLVAARQAIQAGDAGEAQASLERAETRLLNRASLAAGPNRPLRHPGVMEIEQTLDQLGTNDTAGALATIDQLLAQQ